MSRIAFMLIIVELFSCGCSKMPVYPEASFNGASVKIPLNELGEKKPVFFTFHNGNNEINYFVVKTDGSYQAYFDVCAKCYGRKKGYRLDGSRVICRACDVNYSVNDLKDGIGSCYPIKLEGRVEGNFFVIYKEAILAGGKYF